MARTARKKSITNIYHIILRGVNHRVIFEDESDYLLFLDILNHYRIEDEYKVFAYALMNNHIHLLMQFPKNNMSDSMKKIEDKFVWWYNQKYDRCGHLFQERFKSEPVDNEKYLTTVFRYIHQNPYKAGLETIIGIYKWTSYSDYVAEESEIVNVEMMTVLFGGVGPLLKFVKEKNDEVCLEYTAVHMSDSQAIDLIKKHTKCHSLEDLKRESLPNLEALFSYLRKNGVSIRQISRLTGFSRKFVLKSCGNCQ